MWLLDNIDHVHSNYQKEIWIFHPTFSISISARFQGDIEVYWQVLQRSHETYIIHSDEIVADILLPASHQKCQQPISWFSSLHDAFFSGAIVLACLQQQVEISVDRIEAVCHTFREKVFFLHVYNLFCRRACYKELEQSFWKNFTCWIWHECLGIGFNLLRAAGQTRMFQKF